MPLLTDKSGFITSKSQLLEIFLSGIKQEQKIGIENEKLLVNQFSKAASYQDTVKILECFSGFEPVKENGNIIGLTGEKGHISLEPGSQIEFSSFPFLTLNEVSNALKEFLELLHKAADRNNLRVLDTGSQPETIWNDITVIPKSRYDCMTKYLPSKGLEPFRMMRETAGIQVNIDYNSEEDAINKLSLSLKLSPVVSAMYANSPMRNGKLTGLKSIRANAWLNVDESRCGFISPKLLEYNPDFSFKDYMEILLNIPVIFIERNNKSIVSEITFSEFMRNGFNGFYPVLSDWETHLSLFFPEVRLKDHLEIRNHDNQTEEMTMSIPAFWKGILYSDDASEEVRTILKRFSIDDFYELREKTPVFGIDCKIKGIWIKDLAKELVNISKYTLENNDKKYLEPLEELVIQGLTPADVFLKSLK